MAGVRGRRDRHRRLNRETLVQIDPHYFRPTEVDLLLGDATKARTKLGWIPKYDLKQMVAEMVQSDLGLFGESSI